MLFHHPRVTLVVEHKRLILFSMCVDFPIVGNPRSESHYIRRATYDAQSLCVEFFFGGHMLFHYARSTLLVEHKTLILFSVWVDFPHRRHSTKCSILT